MQTKALQGTAITNYSSIINPDLKEHVCIKDNLIKRMYYLIYFLHF